MTKTKNTTLFALFLIIVASIMFTGCGQLTTLTTVYADGSRSYSYAITLDDTVLDAYDLDKTEVMSAINSVVNTYRDTFFSGRDTTGVELTHGIAENSSDVYQILLTFSSFDALCAFLGTSPEEVASTPATIKKGIFVSQEVIADSNLTDSSELLVEMFLIPDLIEGINIAFAERFFGGDRTITNQLFNAIDTYIVRAYPSSLKIKSNADEVATLITNYGVTDPTPTTYSAHLWHCTMGEPVPHIYVYRDVYLNENRIAWYLLGIGIALVFGAILAAVLYFRHKSGKDEPPKEPAFTVIDNGKMLIFEPKNTEPNIQDIAQHDRTLQTDTPPPPPQKSPEENAPVQSDLSTNQSQDTNCTPAKDTEINNNEKQNSTEPHTDTTTSHDTQNTSQVSESTPNDITEKDNNKS